MKVHLAKNYLAALQKRLEKMPSTSSVLIKVSIIELPACPNCGATDSIPVLTKANRQERCTRCGHIIYT